MKRVLLIIDDNEADRYIATRVANKSGEFEHVYTLNDGEEAYQHFKDEEKSAIEKGDNFPPSIVVLDINMPRMNGFEFLRKYKDLPIRNRQDILFVAMLTSSESEEDKQKASEFPFVEVFLSKPFNKEHVAILIKKLNEKKSQ